MSKSIGILLILLPLATRSAAQYPGVKISSEQDSMTTDSKRFMIRWGGTSLGFRLSNDESVLYTDSTAIIIGLNGHPNTLMATYAFNPILLPPGLVLDFGGLKTVVLGDFGSESDPKRFYEIPEWLASLYQVESLTLSNAELRNITFCEHLPLKYLDLRRVHYNSSVLRTIGTLLGLKILVCDDSFSTEDISAIEKKLPGARLVSKPFADNTRRSK